MKVEPPNKNLEVLLNLQHLFIRYEIGEKYFPTVLKFFYDADLLEEEFLVAWYDGGVWAKEEELVRHFLWDKELNERLRLAA